MRIHRLPLIGLALAFGAVAFAGFQPSLAPTAAAAVRSTAINKGHTKAPPRTVKKAKRSVSLAVTKLVGNYAKRRAKTVCNSVTIKTRKLLGGSSCAATVRRVRKAKPISKVKIQKIAFRRARVWTNVTGYLNGQRKQRLTVSFKWEGGRYRLDHSVTPLSRLLR